MTDSYPQILKTEQVAEILGMNVDMVRKAAREGKLPAYRSAGANRHPAGRLSGRGRSGRGYEADFLA